jgi:hypothetical protein
VARWRALLLAPPGWDEPLRLVYGRQRARGIDVAARVDGEALLLARAEQAGVLRDLGFRHGEPELDDLRPIIEREQSSRTSPSPTRASPLADPSSWHGEPGSGDLSAGGRGRSPTRTAAVQHIGEL